MDVWNYTQPYYGKKLAFAFGILFLNERWPLLLWDYKGKTEINVFLIKISYWKLYKALGFKYFIKREMGWFWDQEINSR